MDCKLMLTFILLGGIVVGVSSRSLYKKFKLRIPIKHGSKQAGKNESSKVGKYQDVPYYSTFASYPVGKFTKHDNVVLAYHFKKYVIKSLLAGIPIAIAAFMVSFFWLSTYMGVDGDLDGWHEFAIFMKEWLLGNEKFSNVNEESFSSHAFTPLWPFLAGMMDLLVNNIIVTRILLNSILFSLTIVIVMLVSRKLDSHWISVAAFCSIPVIFMDAIGTLQTAPLYLFTSVAYLSCILIVEESRESWWYIATAGAGILLIFSREINWPLLAFPILLSPFYSATRNEIPWKRLWRVTLFAVIIPVVVYMLFLIPSGALSGIRESFDALESFGKVWQSFVIFTLLSVSIFPFVIKKTDMITFSLLLWMFIFLMSRIVFPGPFWPHYFEQLAFPSVLLGARKRRKPWLLIIVVGNILVSIFIILNPDFILFFMFPPKIIK